VDAVFEARNAQDSPFGVGDHLDQFVFLVGGGGLLFKVAIQVCLVSDGVVGGQEDNFGPSEDGPSGCFAAVAVFAVWRLL
jgi:hypothetical protein